MRFFLHSKMMSAPLPSVASRTDGATAAASVESIATSAPSSSALARRALDRVNAITSEVLGLV